MPRTRSVAVVGLLGLSLCAAIAAAQTPQEEYSGTLTRTCSDGNGGDWPATATRYQGAAYWNCIAPGFEGGALTFTNDQCNVSGTSLTCSSTVGDRSSGFWCSFTFRGSR